MAHIRQTLTLKFAGCISAPVLDLCKYFSTSVLRCESALGWVYLLRKWTEWVFPWLIEKRTLGGVPREQKMFKGHLPRVIYRQGY